jgi:hypothetical protein
MVRTCTLVRVGCWYIEIVREREREREGEREKEGGRDTIEAIGRIFRLSQIFGRRTGTKDEVQIHMMGITRFKKIYTQRNSLDGDQTTTTQHFHSRVYV